MTTSGGQRLADARSGAAAAGSGRGLTAVQRCSSDAADWRGADGQRPSSSGGVAAARAAARGRADQPRRRGIQQRDVGEGRRRPASGGAPAKAARQRQRPLRRDKRRGGALSTGRMCDFVEIATTRWRDLGVGCRVRK
ncbi:hypothetical protein Scep_012389 [Stephania cephalantha]|uniref:Uncharacterized protein n=1 Tax=Stephania cephalantha TaxID=152367 RepID=A0AAP0JEU8_9MAGN